MWWAVTAVGVATAALLWIYDKTLKPATFLNHEQTEDTETRLHRICFVSSVSFVVRPGIRSNRCRCLE